MKSCIYADSEEPKKCNCMVQEYERTVTLKNDHDGTYTDYSDTAWVAKGDPQKDNTVECFRNGTQKSKEFFSSYDSQYRWDVSRQWMYDCK
ncbi:hypothetical protein WH221_05400 [Chryseobacterium culicis]|uniref:Uncharacterized protein n=1 Tax=Chryseobacterium culicis TaxID=680127 RepID=A0A2S9CYX8_CHRCI|nr:hypothetical protein [Chryseobacterium culicis]PRB85684.1 hypothetical protein CQ022_05355 [Chryseobacterium culicis]PRB90592.1 hypothetical protein CQ033_07630 [Chryseobacterium culicis]